MKKLYFIIVLLVFVFFVAACGDWDTGVDKEEKQTDKQLETYVKSQPIPFFEWSLERHLMKELYTARNDAVSTFSVVVGYNGIMIFSCPSIGFPVPGGTQLTNPLQSEGSNGAVIGLMEPNGLYSPDTSAGTYVMCVNRDGTVSPIYVEQYVMAFPYPVEQIDGVFVPVDGALPSLKINPNQP